MAEQPSREDILQFEQTRSQLLGVSGQKQQLLVQSSTMEKALEELGKTSEKKVFKAVGNILIASDVSETKQELKDTKETIELRIKTLQKQEDVLVQKLNKLRAHIEGKPDESQEEEKSETKKNRK